MSHFFLDSSALVKRYVTETGSGWLASITDAAAGNTLVVAEITRVEVAAAIAARHRAPSGLSRSERDGAVALLLKHFNDEYQIIALTPNILSRAVDLTQAHTLRGYDALQLATALAAHQALLRAELLGLTFLVADHALLKAAQAEGLLAEDPNAHIT